MHIWIRKVHLGKETNYLILISFPCLSVHRFGKKYEIDYWHVEDKERMKYDVK